MTDVEAELREQFHDAVDGADFPVTSVMELVPVLPNGARTTFAAGDVDLSAMRLAAKLSDYQDFPYETPDALVDDVIAALKAEEML